MGGLSVGGLSLGGLGDPGGPVPPDAAGALRVWGGAGGTAATLEALIAAGTRAERAARALGSAAACVQRAQAGPFPAAVISEVNQGVGGLPACADRASALAVALRTAVRTYEAADHDARARLNAIVVVAGARAGELGPVGWAVLGTAAGALAFAGGTGVLGLRALRSSPGPFGLVLSQAPDLSGLPGPAGWFGGAVTATGGLLPDGLGLPHGEAMELGVLGLASFSLASLPGTWEPTDRAVEQVAGVLGVVTAGWARFVGLPQREVVVAPLIGPRSSGGGRAELPPEGIGDVVERVAELGDAPGPAVGVQRIDHADGSTGWIVSIPGTRCMDVLPGRDPMDNATNLALMAGQPDAMTEAVEVAMLRAGVGPEDPVLLAGHSQGGMAATRLATSLDGTYSIEAVLTAGSPVGLMPIPADVAALHLEHAQDYVPALDGTPNPDEPQRTTVVRDLPGMDTVTANGTVLGLLPGDVGRAHEAWRYVETAGIVEGMDDPSVAAFRTALERVLGDGKARATTQTFLVARLPAAGDA